jgi:prepilin-type N-terminal cleavage/methylation domain-containing protein
VGDGTQSARGNGFTLIELLVVMAIISLLSSVVIGSVVEARKRAYNARIKQEVHQYVTALQMAYDDIGHYRRLIIQEPIIV